MSSNLSNEELAICIRNGKAEYITQLWDNTYKLLYKYANKYYNIFNEKCAACGVTIEDLQQECFIILWEMIKAYDPEKPYKFNTYAEWQFKNHFFRNLLCKAKGIERAPLNTASSLDKDLQGFEGEDLTMLDVIPDETAVQAFEDVTEFIYHTQLSNTLELAMSEALTDEQRFVIRERFWKERPFSHISRDLMQKDDYIRKIEREALKKLRAYSAKYKRLQAFKEDIITEHSYIGTGLSSFKYTQSSSVERTLELAERLTQKYHN